jgi:hypothetical protein
VKPLELDHPLRNNPVLWLIWVLLGSVVIGGFATLVIALRGADRPLPANYHWEGQNLDRDFARAREAAQLGVEVSLVADPVIGTCLASVRSAPGDPATLTLMLTNGSDPGLDRVVLLRRTSKGEYGASCPAIPEGRWRLSLEDPEGKWIIRTQLAGTLGHLELRARSPEGPMSETS